MNPVVLVLALVTGLTFATCGCGSSIPETRDELLETKEGEVEARVILRPSGQHTFLVIEAMIPLSNDEETVASPALDGKAVIDTPSLFPRRSSDEMPRTGLAWFYLHPGVLDESLQSGYMRASITNDLETLTEIAGRLRGRFTIYYQRYSSAFPNYAQGE